MTYHTAYLEGIRLFNDSLFWHAHEQWEECWHMASGTDVTFYKGMIQAAAALEKWKRGNIRGLHLNWSKSQPKLLILPSPYMGLDVSTFIAAMESFVATEHTKTFPRLPKSFSIVCHWVRLSKKHLANSKLHLCYTAPRN